jgi:hypothetical protein
MKDNQITITINHPKNTQIKREIMGLLHIFYNCSTSGNNCVIKHPHMTGGDTDDEITEDTTETPEEIVETPEEIAETPEEITETPEEIDGESGQTGGGILDFAEGILGDVKEEHEQSAGRAFNKIMPGSSYTPRKKTLKKTRFQ